MTTTNTAARELLDRMRKWGSENWSAASPALVREWADQLEATLTQQQGGEQEAGEIELPELPAATPMEPHRNGDYERGYYAEHMQDYAREAVAMALASTAADGIDRAAVAAWWRVAQTLDKLCPEWSDNDLDGADAAEQAITAALRTKQPAASEGGGEGIDDQALDAALLAARNATWNIGEDVSHSSAEKIALAVIAALRNTSKQAAGEAVACEQCKGIGMFMVGDAQGICSCAAGEAERDARGLPPTTPPRHPADEDAEILAKAWDVARNSGTNWNLYTAEDFMDAVMAQARALQAGTP